MFLCHRVVLTLIVVQICRGCPATHHCQGDVCDSVTGNCLKGCEQNWNGPKCNTQNVCLTCKWGHCDENRICVSGCVSGYYGDTCNKTCSSHCSGKCDMTSGTCLGVCKKGWYGPYCSSRCGSGCAQQCHRWHGTCSCTSGWYGRRCSLNCNRCVDNLCDPVHGRCSRGCTLWWTGPTCSNYTCRACRNITCVISGVGFVCNLGCHAGYWGSKCDQRCNGGCDSCVQNNGTCLQNKDISEDLPCDATCITHLRLDGRQTTHVQAKGHNGGCALRDTTTIPVTTDAYTTATKQDSAPVSSPDGRLNVKTRWYIFTWVSIFVIFLISIVIWCLYKEWTKHKMETRAIHNYLELASLTYMPGHYGKEERCMQFDDSGLYMELDDVTPTDASNQGHVSHVDSIDFQPNDFIPIRMEEHTTV